LELSDTGKTAGAECEPRSAGKSAIKRNPTIGTIRRSKSSHFVVPIRCREHGSASNYFSEDAFV
jgi:hypothetical protein